MIWLKAFIAGFLATLIFHQGLIGLLNLASVIPVTPYTMTPVPPIGIPAVLSLSFFGGLWGIALWAIVRSMAGVKFWAVAAIFGAIAPTVVAMLVVLPMKGRDVAPMMWVFGMILNGFWGFGTALLMQLMGGRKTAPARSGAV